MNIFTYIQHLYTAIVLCKCVLTYIFSNYYKIHKEGKTQVCLESGWSTASTPSGSRACVVAHGTVRHPQGPSSSPHEGDKFPTV